MGAIIEILKYGLSRILKKMRMSSIKKSLVHSTSVIESGSQIINTVMDRHSFCGYDCVLLNCEIGGFCSIADQVYIGGSHHPMHFASTSPVFLSHIDSVKEKFAKIDYEHMPKTTIGNDVWIGHGAKIKAGVSIGHGAVIGMATIVTKDVPAYAVVVGNPGKIVKYRFEPSIIKALLASNWWDASEEDLHKIGGYIENPSEFAKRASAL